MLVSARSSPKVASRPRNDCVSQAGSTSSSRSRRYAEKQPEAHVTAPKIDSEPLITRKATK